MAVFKNKSDRNINLTIDILNKIKVKIVLKKVKFPTRFSMALKQKNIKLSFLQSNINKI
jgi:hypothetical protein